MKSVNITVFDVIEHVTNVVRSVDIVRVVGVEDTDRLYFLNCRRRSRWRRWRFALSRRLRLLCEGEFLLRRRTTMVGSLAVWTDSFGHRFKGSYDVALPVHRLLGRIARHPLIISFIQELFSLTQIADKDLEFPLLIEVH